jgi:hypothetical protein
LSVEWMLAQGAAPVPPGGAAIPHVTNGAIPRFPVGRCEGTLWCPSRRLARLVSFGNTGMRDCATPNSTRLLSANSRQEVGRYHHLGAPTSPLAAHIRPIIVPMPRRCSGAARADGFVPLEPGRRPLPDPATTFANSIISIPFAQCKSATNRDPARDCSYHVDSGPIISVWWGPYRRRSGPFCSAVSRLRIKGVTRARAGSRFGTDPHHAPLPAYE